MHHRARLTSGALPLLMAFTVASCSAGGSAPSSGDPGGGSAVVFEDGVATVTNAHGPLFDAAAIEVRSLWSSTGPRDGSDQWGELSRVVVGGGVVFLVDSPLGRIHRVSLNGTPLTGIGKRGQGPGEFQTLTTVAPVGDGVASLDLNSRVLLFDRDGEYERLLAMGDVGELLPLGVDRLLVFEIIERRWSRLGLEGSRNPIELPPLPPLEGDTKPECVRFAAWEGGIARLRCAVPHVDVIDSAGSLLRRIVLPGGVTRTAATRQTADQSRKAAAYGRVMSEGGMSGASIARVLAKVSAQTSDLVDKYRGVAFDGLSGLAAVWEQAQDGVESATCSLHLMTTEGHYLASLAFDETWIDMALADGVLITLHLDSEGRSEVRARRLVLPSDDLATARTPVPASPP